MPFEQPVDCQLTLLACCTKTGHEAKLACAYTSRLSAILSVY